MIPKIKYEDLKAYYDFQRVKEYQKELLRAIVEKVGHAASSAGGTFIGGNVDSIVNEMLVHHTEDAYFKPPINYVPADVKWRIEGEDYEDWKRVKKNIQIMNQYVWRKDGN
jgi:hypothetical protein